MRKPTSEELGILEYLAKKANLTLNPVWYKLLAVEPMKDGGMGSLTLYPNWENFNPDREFGAQVSDYQFKDKDGVPVIASLNLDKEGYLYELDIWKTNYEPLIALPSTID